MASIGYGINPPGYGLDPYGDPQLVEIAVVFHKMSNVVQLDISGVAESQSRFIVARIMTDLDNPQ